MTYLEKKNIEWDEIRALTSMAVLLFLLVNPLYLIILYLIYYGHNKSIDGVVVGLFLFSFSLFFFKREYGIWFNRFAYDDVVSYLQHYANSKGENILVAVSESLSGAVSYSGHEPAWKIYVFFVQNILGFSDKCFVLLTYFLIILLVYKSFYLVDKKWAIYMFLIYFSLSESSLYSVTHIWRQQIAFSLLFIGYVLVVKKRVLVGLIILFSSVLFHLSAVFYLCLALILLLIDKKEYLDFKKGVWLLLVIGLATPIVFTLLINFGADILNSSRVLLYIVDSGMDRRGAFVTAGIMGMFLVLLWMYRKYDRVSRFIFYMYFFAYSVMLSYPYMNSIYDRLMMFVRPLVGIVIFLFIKESFNSELVKKISVLLIVFGVILGLIEKNSIYDILGNGDFFNPFAGVLYMVFLNSAVL